MALACVGNGPRVQALDLLPGRTPTFEVDAASEPLWVGDAAPTDVRVSSRSPGLPETDAWISFYGTARQMGDIDRVARTFRIINIDADPAADGGNFSDEEIRRLKGNGRNTILSYVNLGSCERFRTYWTSAPNGLIPCGVNRAAWLGAYRGYPAETWMDPSNEDYRRLILEHVMVRIASRGVDGFYLDNMEIAEHDDPANSGWCSPTCRQGALDLVRMIRHRFPDRVIVMQNATGDTTRLGTTGGIRFPELLDGVVHESVYTPVLDERAESELLAWQAMGMVSRCGLPFFVGVEDYVGSCSNVASASEAYGNSRAHGFVPSISDASNSQKVICYWPFADPRK